MIKYPSPSAPTIFIYAISIGFRYSSIWEYQIMLMFKDLWCRIIAELEERNKNGLPSLSQEMIV
jgi:hypothetical protein